MRKAFVYEETQRLSKVSLLFDSAREGRGGEAQMDCD